jgi:putative sigma-54 modulation protein
MNLIISGRHIQISNHLEEYIEEKTTKLAKHMPTLGEVRVEVAINETRADTDRFTCQITTWLDQHMLDAQSSGGDVHKAINSAIAKFDRQLEKMKIQHQHKGRPSLASNSEQALANLQANE